MTSLRPWMHLSRRLAAVVLVVVSIGTHSATIDAQQGGDSFEHWATVHAIPIETVEPGSAVADLRALKPIIGAARVIALGEPTHGAHEPLAFRNRLFRYLVEELGFTAIALESGLPESRRISDFVFGGPGEARQVVRENLTWGFGAFGENEELVRWMRDYNADPAHRRKVRFYGIDLSLGGPGGSIPTSAALDQALSYFARVDPVSARRIRATFQPYLSVLSGAGSPSLSRAEHDAASAAIDDLISLLERERPTFVAATSEADYEWAYRNAIVARQGDRAFRVNPPEMPGGGIPPAAWQAVTARDAAMAENVQWVLAQEGPAGRVLVFAHNAHVKNARTEGGVWSVFERPPNAMGQYLRSTLGDNLVIIGTSSAQKAVGLPPASEAGSIDAALARVGPPRFVLDLRLSRADRAVAAWLAERRSLRANDTTYQMLSPGAAFDAFLFVNMLTPSRTASPPR
jgi:erythromycin esterase